MSLDITQPERSAFRCDPGALKRLLCNLVGNALKYTEFGYISLKIAVDSSSKIRSKDEVVFVVSDSGRGISQEYLTDRLYTPFSQENPHTIGTGLGLSIVKQIVTSLKGTIDVKSKETVGTEVRTSFKFPRSDTSMGPHTSFEVQKTTKGKTFRLIGFEDTQDDTSPMRMADAVLRGKALLGRSIDKCCRLIFYMEPWDSGALDTPGVIVTPMTEASDHLAALKAHNAPIIIVCPDPTSSEAFKKEHQTLIDSTIHCVSQP